MSNVPRTAAWLIGAYGLQRAAAPYSPTDEGANLVLWLDASDTDTITTDANGVTQIDDKSGSGNNGTQSSGTSSDYLQNGGSINGLNAVTGDGGSTHLEVPNPAVSSEMSVYFVIEPSSLGYTILIRAAGTGRYACAWDDGSADDADNQFGSPEYFVNGVSQGSGITRDTLHAALTVDTPTIITMIGLNNGDSGWAVPYDGVAILGDIGEVIAVTGSGGERSDMESYLADKWGITL